MVTNVLYDLHKHLHLPQPHLMTAGWLGCHAETVMENRVLPASRPNPEVRHPASQTARLSPLGQQKVWSLTMWLVHFRIASRKATCQSFRHPSSQHPANQHSAQSTTQHPLQLLFSVSPPSFVPQAPSQLNIVPSNPTDPHGSGSANETHNPNKMSLSHSG